MSNELATRSNGAGQIQKQGRAEIAAYDLNELQQQNALEQVITSGNLAALSGEQRVRYYMALCQSLGLNPYTKPFEYAILQAGKMVLYANKECAAQIRAIRKLSIDSVEKEWDGSLYTVTVHCSLPDGRRDMDFAAIHADKLQGDALANAMMKCMTKAKRRATLSACGLGYLDETEVESTPGARRISIDEAHGLIEIEAGPVVQATTLEAPAANPAPAAPAKAKTDPELSKAIEHYKIRRAELGFKPVKNSELKIEICANAGLEADAELTAQNVIQARMRLEQSDDALEVATDETPVVTPSSINDPFSEE